MILLGINKSLVYGIYVCKHFIRNVYKKWLIFVRALNARDQTLPRLELGRVETRVETRLTLNRSCGRFFND
jgi:hypothetical protein